MIHNIFKVLISVKAKLFFGFLSMTLVIALLGGYAFMSIGGAGAVVKDTFDRPLMAINYARSAGQVFTQLELEVLRQVNTQATQTALDRDRIQKRLEGFRQDLNIARERSISTRAAPYFDRVNENLTAWEHMVLHPSTAMTPQLADQALELGEAIEEQLDIIVELQTNASFLAREAAIKRMNTIKRLSVFAGLAALALSLLLSAWIAVTIINPLKAAASAARKISAGDLNADIPPGGDDETGVLLKTMAAMQTNIRERMSKEQDLRALAQHRLSDSLTNSKDAILLTDAQGAVIVANPQIGRMFPALANFNLIGRPYAHFFTGSGAPLNDACTYDETRGEIRFEDGRWARISASATREGGRLYIWSDITKAKDRSQKLREARDKAQTADKAKTLFLAAMSHELRTPLNAVIGFSDLLEKENNRENGNAQHAEMAGLISQSGAQLLNIVQDVLMVAEGGRTEDIIMKKEPVQLSGCIDFCLKTIAAEARKKAITISTELDAPHARVTGDTLRLQQVLLNLLSNAIKFNNESGHVKVKLSEHAPSGRVFLDVIDNGIGIEPHELDRIMEPFAQVDEGHTRKFDGVGLGLTIVQQIVAGHKGEVIIRSKFGTGTAVRISMAAYEEAAAQPSQTAQGVLTEPQPGSDRHVA